MVLITWVPAPSSRVGSQAIANVLSFDTLRWDAARSMRRSCDHH